MSWRLQHLVCLIGVLFASGCATIISGGTQEIAIESNVPGAMVQAGAQTTQTPGVLRLRRGTRESFEVSAPGYQSRTVRPRREANPAVAINCLCGGLGLIGLIVDVASGSAYNYPRLLFVRLDPALRPFGGRRRPGDGPAFVWPALLRPGPGPAPLTGGPAALPRSAPAPLFADEGLVAGGDPRAEDAAELSAPPLLIAPEGAAPAGAILGAEPSPL